jgi:GNAT superfamily N-acetyltransferase
MMERKSIHDRLRISFSLPEEIDDIASSLGKHLSPEKQAALWDKIERYTRKEDRVVVIGRIDDEIVGYFLVIEYLDPPDTLDEEVRKRIARYGCLTGLGVNPEWRRNGIGGKLFAEGLKWAEERGLPGVWLRTRLFAEWYIRDFGFEKIGTVTIKETVVKSVLAKVFRHE